MACLYDRLKRPIQRTTAVSRLCTQLQQTAKLAQSVVHYSLSIQHGLLANLLRSSWRLGVSLPHTSVLKPSTYCHSACALSQARFLHLAHCDEKT